MSAPEQADSNTPGTSQVRLAGSSWVRDLHLYAGLFVSPFVLLFAFSVFFLVHPGLSSRGTDLEPERSVTDLPLPANLDQLSGRERIAALRPALDRAQVHGEVGWIEHRVQEQRLVMPVTVPGRVVTVSIDLVKREASVRERGTGLTGALVELHKSPGPHLVAIRQNWWGARLWAWFADATVLLLLFITLSGVYLWWWVRRERRAGLFLLGAGALFFLSLVYALVV